MEDVAPDLADVRRWHVEEARDVLLIAYHTAHTAHTAPKRLRGTLGHLGRATLSARCSGWRPIV